MKKILLVLAFAMTYAFSLSIGLECLLNLLGVMMAISLDGPAVTEQYPRFIPFCLMVGVFVLAVIIVTFILNLKASGKFAFTKRLWVTEIIIAFVISIPMIKFWEMFFEFLQKSILI